MGLLLQQQLVAALQASSVQVPQTARRPQQQAAGDHHQPAAAARPQMVAAGDCFLRWQQWARVSCLHVCRPSHRLVGGGRLVSNQQPHRDLLRLVLLLGVGRLVCPRAHPRAHLLLLCQRHL